MVSDDIDHVLMHPVPQMSADGRPQTDDTRGAIDALADRVDTLASIVRETAGALSASRGEVASLDRRVQDRIAEDTQRSATALGSLRGELDALRAFVADAPGKSGAVEAAASNPLNETVATLTERVETLGGIIRSTAGSLAAEQSRLSVLSDALAKGDERVEARLAAMQQELRAVSETAARTVAPAPVDTELLEQRVEQKVGDLAERIDFLASTVSTTAGKLAAREGDLARVEQLIVGQESFQSSDAVRLLSEDLAALKERVAVDPELEEKVGGLVETVQALGDRVGALSSIVSETAGRRGGHESEIAALDERLGQVGSRIDDVALQLRVEIESLAAAPVAGSPGTDAAELELKFTQFGEQLARLGTVVEDASGAAEQVRAELRLEIAALAEAVQRERIDLDLATSEWEARRAALEERMDELALFATATTERGVDEMGRALHTLADRLERLEHDRQAVTADASNAEKTWALERVALEARLDAIASSITEERPQGPEVGLLIDELAGRLARMESERETVADLAALAETWTAELASLEARVDEGLSTLQEQGAQESTEGAEGSIDAGLSESLEELAQRIGHIEHDRDAVREELARSATSWAAERASLQERVSELAARIVTGPTLDASDEESAAFAQNPQEVDRLRIGVEGLRMRLAYHEKTVSDLGGSRGVVKRLDELTARVEQLAAIVASGAFQAGASAAAGQAGNANPMPVPILSPDTSGLISRLEESERQRGEMREKMLDQMEKIASRMDWRLQRLETSTEAPVASS